MKKAPRIWAVGGGKGGVGKSLVASSLAIQLARKGRSVIAADLDLGGANLHTALGADLPQQTLSDFFGSKPVGLAQCVSRSEIPNLSILSGAQDSLGITNISEAQRKTFIDAARGLSSDYLIIDLGAGTAFYTLDFFLAADVGIITVLPEPTSIENTYRFIKSAYYRKLATSPELQDLRTLIEMAMDPKNPLQMKSPADLYREVSQSSPDAAIRLKSVIETFRPQLIVNQARTASDVEIGNSIKTVCKKYFGITMGYLGALDYDAAVWQSVRRKKPLVLEFPNSRLVSEIDGFTQTLLRAEI